MRVAYQRFWGPLAQSSSSFMSLISFFINNNKSNTCLWFKKNWKVQLSKEGQKDHSQETTVNDLLHVSFYLLLSYLPLPEGKTEWNSTRELAKVTDVLFVTKFNAHFAALPRTWHHRLYPPPWISISDFDHILTTYLLASVLCRFHGCVFFLLRFKNGEAPQALKYY